MAKAMLKVHWFSDLFPGGACASSRIPGADGTNNPNEITCRVCARAVVRNWKYIERPMYRRLRRVAGILPSIYE